MKKLKLLLFICSVMIISCNPDNDVTTSTSGLPVLQLKQKQESVPSGSPMTKADLKKLADDELQKHNDFRWSNLSLYELWSGASLTKSIAVGYKPSGVKDISENIHTINIKSAEWKAVHDALINHVVEVINKNNTIQVNANDIIEEDDNVLPIIVFKTSDKFAITALYNLENVRYIEPYGFWPYDDDRSSSGCGGSSEPLNAADFTTTTPGCIVPWNFASLNIPAAWNVASGAGIQIGLIDGGISSSQGLLNSQFNTGLSSGRTITADYTYSNTAYTTCTHGTSMCGLAAGPRNAQNATTGVAYNANLHFVRASDDVVLDKSSELTGVKNALVLLGNEPTIKIISMSIGTPFYSSVLYDGVSYAYGKGKLIFAAAGTSFSWTSWFGVIYPASFSQCVAITGVKENGSTCVTCHDGSAVQFTIPMERNNNSSRNSLSLPLSGFTPTYIGGSSCATATTAGIAALVWSVKPALTRAQILTCLTNTAQYYPVKTSSHGYGNLNAAAAVTMAQGM